MVSYSFATSDACCRAVAPANLYCVPLNQRLKDFFLKHGVKQVTMSEGNMGPA